MHDMMRQVACLTVAVWVCGVAVACRHDASENGNWIRGDSTVRWTTVARHLRGLDVAMVEIGYRYQELYWAGVDSNWEYADYQLKKIDLALENALERRPKRRVSSDAIFVPSSAELKQAIALKEWPRFDEGFSRMTAACNSCHVAEGVPSFYVELPTDRQSSIRAPR